MIKACVQFDSYAADYEIKGELHSVRSIDGVQSVSLFQRVNGEVPMYLLEITVDDAKAEALRSRLQGIQNQYPGAVSNLKVATYRTS